MDDKQKEEAALEQEAAKEIKEEEIKANIITEFGFDAVDDAEKIDKLVAKEIDGRKRLSSAIGQKIKYRTDLETEKQKSAKPLQSQERTNVAPEDVGKIVSQELEKRDLDAMDYPEDLKKEIQRVASIQGVSIKQASRDPYIVNKVTEYEKEKKSDEATISRTNRGGGTTAKRNWSFDNPPDVDMTTPEGRKVWGEYKSEMTRQGY